MRTFIVGLLFRRKWFALHHLTYTHIQRWQEILKNYLTGFSKNFAPSQYIANTLKGKCLVIPNFYSEEFRRMSEIPKEKDIVFVGRLVSDKGADDLLKALQLLHQQGHRYSCSIIGEGTEEKRLKAIVSESEVEKYVTFRGPLRGKDLVAAVNAHKVLVVPSKWPEPFGVVVLEGLACWCRIVCSSDGGLSEAASGFATQYPNNDVEALAKALQEGITKGELSSNELTKVAEYLSKRTSWVIASRYIEVFANGVIPAEQ